MEVRARSKAARKVWDTADKFTRDTLGFSVLHVVRDNPTSLIASGVHYHHPEGVLYPDAVHPGRDGDRGRRAGRRDA